VQQLQEHEAKFAKRKSEGYRGKGGIKLRAALVPFKFKTIERYRIIPE
jgi:hypothetical protein